MKGHIYVICAEWDAEAKVWFAFSDDVPGLATGAETLEDLVEKLKVVVPELLEENGLLSGADAGREVPFSVIAQRFERAYRTA